MNERIGALTHPSTDGAQLRQAMRRLASGITLVTAGIGPERVGLTATSVTSLAVEPPTMLVCINRNSTTLPVVLARRHFCISILGSGERELAERFAGFGNVRGAARFEGVDWIVMRSGASGLARASALVDCEVEEVIERHSHAIILGAVREVRLNEEPPGALLYEGGGFVELPPG